MRHLPFAMTLLCASFLTTPLLAQNPFGSAQAKLIQEPPCEAMARAAYTAARSDAESAFWMNCAELLNDPDRNFSAGFKTAWAQRREALALALEQHQARLSACAALGHGAYAPQLDPLEFSAQVNGALYPLPVGRTYVYESQTSAGLERIESLVLDRVLVIAGIPCRTVSNVETLDGVLKEHTLDWFSQRADGAVWYFGEVSQEFEDGILISMDGSWRAGRDGAKPGVQIPALPQLGDVYRMEFRLGQAEDLARVVAVQQTVTVPAGTFTDCVAIEEWSPLDIRELVMKYFAPNAGMVLEVNLHTGERLELIEVR